MQARERSSFLYSLSCGGSGLPKNILDMSKMEVDAAKKIESFRKNNLTLYTSFL